MSVNDNLDLSSCAAGVDGVDEVSCAKNQLVIASGGGVGCETNPNVQNIDPNCINGRLVTDDTAAIGEEACGTEAATVQSIDSNCINNKVVINQDSILGNEACSGPLVVSVECSNNTNNCIETIAGLEEAVACTGQPTLSSDESRIFYEGTAISSADIQAVCNGLCGAGDNQLGICTTELLDFSQVIT